MTAITKHIYGPACEFDRPGTRTLPLSSDWPAGVERASPALLDDPAITAVAELALDRDRWRKEAEALLGKARRFAEALERNRAKNYVGLRLTPAEVMILEDFLRSYPQAELFGELPIG